VQQNKNDDNWGLLMIINFLMVALGYCLLFLLSFAVKAETKDIIPPFEIPTFSGKPIDYHIIKPSINPAKVIDVDRIFDVVNRCYPLKSGFGLDVSLKSGVNYKDNAGGTSQINTLDSNQFYAGIVASMPLYSDLEIDKERKLEYQRRQETTNTIKELTVAVANKRRSERMLGLYLSLEKRAQERVKIGVTEPTEQIAFLDKVASIQGDLDTANATIESARLALIGQCRSEVMERVNDYIISQIN
jgi:hypothetical protein